MKLAKTQCSSSIIYNIFLDAALQSYSGSQEGNVKKEATTTYTTWTFSLQIDFDIFYEIKYN